MPATPQKPANSQATHHQRMMFRFGMCAGTMSRVDCSGHHRFRIGMTNDTVASIGLRRAGRPDAHPLDAAR